MNLTFINGSAQQQAWCQKVIAESHIDWTKVVANVSVQWVDDPDPTGHHNDYAYTEVNGASSDIQMRSDLGASNRDFALFSDVFHHELGHVWLGLLNVDLETTFPPLFRRGAEQGAAADWSPTTEWPTRVIEGHCETFKDVFAATRKWNNRAYWRLPASSFDAWLEAIALPDQPGTGGQHEGPFVIAWTLPTTDPSNPPFRAAGTTGWYDTSVQQVNPPAGATNVQDLLSFTLEVEFADGHGSSPADFPDVPFALLSYEGWSTTFTIHDARVTSFIDTGAAVGALIVAVQNLAIPNTQRGPAAMTIIDWTDTVDGMLINVASPAGMQPESVWSWDAPGTAGQPGYAPVAPFPYVEPVLSLSAASQGARARLRKVVGQSAADMLLPGQSFGSN